MNHSIFHQPLIRVGTRFAQLWQSIGRLIVWCLLTLIGLAVTLIASTHDHPVNRWTIIILVAIAILIVPILSRLVRRTRDPVWIAHRLEKQYPDLNARLLTAIEQKPNPDTQQYGYLQQAVFGEVIDHAKDHRWDSVVSSSKLFFFQWASRLALVAFAIVTALMLFTNRNLHGQSADDSFAANFTIQVEPGDTNIERGTGMLVLARFKGELPGKVELLSKAADGSIQQVQMSKSLDDPVFASRIPIIKSDLQYAVRYGSTETQWYSAKVFDYPDLKQSDANLKYPTYTKLPEKRIDDVRSLTAVEGTSATLQFHLNKPVAQAKLLPTTRPAVQANDSQVKSEPIKLVVDAKDPTLYTAVIDMKQTQLLKLQLVDSDGRQNKQPAAELSINVNPNRPPEMKPVLPGRDVDVSPIQELSTGVKVSDDFGVRRVGISYAMPGQLPLEIVLGSDIPANEKKDVAHLISFEQLKAEPDQLLSYFFWAEDYAADGSIRRTSSDMYFAEVRPFEEIFRQGQQTSASQQQQQQEQQQNGNSQNAQQAEEIAELQKLIIAATWKIIRRESGSSLSSTFATDVNLIRDSQTSARERAGPMRERLTDAKSQTYLKNVLSFMEQAVTSLNAAATGSTLPPLTQALASEQAAYQELLKLRAREFEVIRGNRQQQQNGRNQSASSAANRRQQQLDQLQLDQEQNRYETQNSAANQPQENPQQRETRQVLNRLKELAQRQEDINRQMREIQSALEQSRDPQQKDELQRQLARLRDQQQQQLRDTDELRDRMDQPENQQRMTEQRQQLEQTREDVRRASEALDQSKVPEAATSGARASEQLNNLRDQVRREASGQFTETMTDLRDQTRKLDDNQKQLSEKLKTLDAADQRSLRQNPDRQQVAEQLGEQKKQLDQVLDNMRKTVDESENVEPLLSRQLYDTLRQAGQAKTDQALDVSKQLLERGFTSESKQAETEAGKGITQLREGVEQAASSVLGNETDSLRRARGELDRLTDELQREVDRNRPAGLAGSPTTRPTNGASIAQNGQTSTRPSQVSRNSANPTTRNSDQVARGDQPNQQNPQNGNQLQSGNDQEQANRDQQAGNQRPGNQRGQPSQQQANRQRQGLRGQGQNPGERDPANQNQPGNPQDQQANANDQSQQPGDQQQPNGQSQSGQQGQRAQQGRQGQPRDPSQQDQQANQGQNGQQGNPEGQPNAGQGQQANNDPQNRDQNRSNQRDQRTAQRGTVQQNGAANNNENGLGIDDGTGPLTGDNFRDWSDRLRDVEEMVTDPQLRDRAARIRQRARDIRGESKRHSEQPNWDIVQHELGQPLAELRDAVAQELMKRQSPEALVPLDREAVPPQFADQVKQYYERLGGGK